MAGESGVKRRMRVALKEELGVTYNPLSREWRRSRDMDVNYMLVGVKAG